jgi:hypothetical protein
MAYFICEELGQMTNPVHTQQTEPARMFHQNLGDDYENYVQAKILETALKVITFYQSGDIPSAHTNLEKLESWAELHHLYSRVNEMPPINFIDFLYLIGPLQLFSVTRE